MCTFAAMFQPEATNRRRGHASQMEVYSVAALRFAQKFRSDESAQTMAEYAVVLAVVTLLVVGAITVLSVNVAGQIARIASYVNLA